MPEINNSLAAQINANPIDLKGTLGTLSQIQLAQAHAGLYGLQSQQEARKLNALQYLKDNPTDYMGYIQQGGDPSVGSTLQGMGEKERQFSSNPLGLATENYKHVADTAKTMADTKEKGIMTGAQIAQGVLSDPSNDSVWRNAVNQHYQTHGGSALEMQQMLGVKDPQTRTNIAKAYAAQGVPPGTFAAPHTYSPTQAVTTPGANYAVPQTGPAANRAPIPSSGRVVGDDEAVRTGLYDPTTEQTQRGVTPNARVAQGFGASQPTMTPGQQKEQETLGADTAKHYTESQEAYKHANATQYGLMDIEKNLSKLPEGGFWTPGAGAGTRAAIAKAVNSSMEVANLPPVFDPAKVAAAEAANKGTTRLGFDLARTLGSREAAMIVQQSIGVQPGIEMTTQGNRRIMSSLNAAAQRDKDYFEYLTQFKKDNPSALPGDALVAFNNERPPSRYIEDVNKMVTIPPAAVSALRKDPKLAIQFNEYYGDGMSRYYLGK